MKKQWYIAVVLILAIIVGLACAYLYEISNEQITYGPPNIRDLASMTFSGVSGAAPNYINMTIRNVGPMPWTLTNTAQVNNYIGLAVTSTGNIGALNCTDRNSIKIGIKMTPTAWVSGNMYSVTLSMTDGTKITWVKSAP